MRRPLVYFAISRKLRILTTGAIEAVTPMTQFPIEDPMPTHPRASLPTPIDSLATRIFGVLRYVTLWALLRATLGRHWRHFLFRGEFTPEEVRNSKFSQQRSWVVDFYVLLWVVGGVIAFTCICLYEPSSIMRWVLLVVAALRLTETVQSPLNTLVFDYSRGRTDSQTASSSRLLILSFINVAEFALWFAIVYALNFSLLHGAVDRADALYFSVLTQFTVGYGDIHPVGALKWLVVLQVLFGFVLVVFVIARAVTALPAVEGLLDKPRGISRNDAA